MPADRISAGDGPDARRMRSALAALARLDRAAALLIAMAQEADETDDPTIRRTHLDEAAAGCRELADRLSRAADAFQAVRRADPDQPAQSAARRRPARQEARQ